MSQCRASRANSSDLRPASSSVHQGQPCQPCLLCKRANLSKYFHPKSWKDESLIYRLQQFEPTLDIQPNSCICRGCRNDINSIGKDSFVPRWRKDRNLEGTANECYVSDCMENACKVTTLADKSTACSLFHMELENSEPIETTNSGEGIPLCTYHYGMIYRHINPSHMKCKTCSKHISDITNSRPIPEPSAIEAFLSANMDCRDPISPHDRVCFTCHKSYRVVIKHLKGTVQSTDTELKTIIDKIEGDLPPSQSDITTFDGALSYVSSLSAIHVGKALLRQTALLLPEVYESFKTQLLDLTTQLNIKSKQDVPGTIWLRSQLSTMLEHHMAYKCSVLRIGTILYRFGGDIFHALSISLGQARNHDSTDHLSEVCLNLNKKCHASIKEMVQQDAVAPHNIESIDINKLISELDPDIWRAITLLTKPLSKKTARNEATQVRTLR